MAPPERWGSRSGPEFFAPLLFASNPVPLALELLLVREEEDDDDDFDVVDGRWDEEARCELE
jgi:hypothetical protein